MRKTAWGLGVWVLLACCSGFASATVLRCGDVAGDAEAVAAFQDGLTRSCDCFSTADRLTYRRCALQAANAAMRSGTLARRCLHKVLGCTRATVIGKPGAVVCCRTDSRGHTRGVISLSADKCRAPLNGRACVSDAASVCGGCDANGCVYRPTPTPIPTATPTPDVCPAANLPALAHVPFKVNAGTADCGGAMLQPDAAPPWSGSVEDTDGNKVADLGLGCMYAGNLPGVSLPDGGVSFLDVVGISAASLSLAGSAGSGPTNCTRGASATTHCINGEAGTDGQGACATDADCGGTHAACAVDANCFFGPPIPAANGGLSACVIPAILDDACGEVTVDGNVTLRLRLAARLYATGDPDSPCPVCSGGTCSAGPRAGESCTAVGSKLTSLDCPPDPGVFLATLTVPITSLTTGTTTLVENGGMFCAAPPTPTLGGERRFCVRPTPTPAAFGIAGAGSITEAGTPLLGGGSTNVTLGGLFCVPPTQTFLDQFAQINGPGAVSASGSLDLSSVLTLPLLP